MQNCTQILNPHNMKRILTPSPPRAYFEVDLENFRPALCTETLVRI